MSVCRWSSQLSSKAQTSSKGNYRCVFWHREDVILYLKLEGKKYSEQL